MSRLQIELAQQKENRLAAERRERDEKCEKIVAKVCLEYLKRTRSTYTPIAVAWLPTPQQLLQFPVVTQAFEDGDSTSDEVHHRVESAFATAAETFPSWLQARVDCLMKLVPQTLRKPRIARPQNTQLRVLARNLRISTPLHPLALACATFRCTSSGCKASRAKMKNAAPGIEILLHRCEIEQGGVQTGLSVEFDPEVYGVVLEVLRLLRRKSSCSTGLDLDRRDARFKCVSCTNEGQEYPPETWRALVGTFSSMWCAVSSKCLWQVAHHTSLCEFEVLGKKATETARSRERSNSYHSEPQGWGCCHCFAHLDHRQWFNRREINAHVANVCVPIY